LKSVIQYGFLLILGAGQVTGCSNPPEYPVEPSISFDNVYFKAGDNSLIPDTLFVSVNFKDGDGDLGLDDSYLYEPYNALWGYTKQDGSWITYADRNTPPYDTLPNYEFPYSCYNYLIDESDTIYVQQNLIITIYLLIFMFARTANIHIMTGYWPSLLNAVKATTEDSPF